MPAIHMRLTFEFTSENQSEQILDAVTEALFDLESSNSTLHDADVSASLEKRNISLAIVGTGETIDDASANASSAIRAAIHTSGGATPGWDETVELARSQAVFKFLEQTSVPA